MQSATCGGSPRRIGFVGTLDEIQAQLAATQEELAGLDARRAMLNAQLSRLRQEQAQAALAEGGAVTYRSSEEAKVALFRSLFRGRSDVYARRFESSRTGKHGYQPACGNEWVSGVCEKPRLRCDACGQRQWLPLDDIVVRNHLMGMDPQDRSGRDFTIGVYPMLPDGTCWFLAADFDKASWQEDVRAFLGVCGLHGVPAALERSRSGNGGHCWILFSDPVPAPLARRLGTLLVTQTMDCRPEIGLDSYDRLYPSQDTVTREGFGSLIALPLQRKPREQGNSVFVDEAFRPYPDQWQFLASLHRLSRSDAERIAGAEGTHDPLMGIRMPVQEDDAGEPWKTPPSRRADAVAIVGPLPERMDLVTGNQVYVPKADLPPSLRTRLVRLAAFQNPEFYQAQMMRLSTYGKPRIIGCCEEYPEHLGLPRGCLDEVLQLLRQAGIATELRDQRCTGVPLDVHFRGALRPAQQQAAAALLSHDTGVLAASTAFGKTVVAAYLIGARRVNTLVVVHRRQLVDQWVDVLSSFLELAATEIGRIGGGKHQCTGRIDVATVQSLVRKGVVDDLVGNYGYLVVDECHHISAVSFEQVARQSKARYVTGLSATVVRKDGHHPIVFMQCGPVRFRLSDRVQARQRPFAHKVVVRPTGFRLPDHLASVASPSIHDVYDALVRDEGRNRLIVQDVVAAVNAGRSPVLLTERREHLDLLVGLLADQVEETIVMTGGMGVRQRRRLAERIGGLPPGQPRLIAATGRYLGEGFDDAQLDTLFLALPVSWRGTLTQYAGRLHRSHAGKTEVIIYDYVDYGVAMLEKMHARRRTGYKAIGYEVLRTGEARDDDLFAAAHGLHCPVPTGGQAQVVP